MRLGRYWKARERMEDSQSARKGRGKTEKRERKEEINCEERGRKGENRDSRGLGVERV